MLDEFKEENLVNLVGGRFRLTSLIQKRMVAINRGARPLVDLQTKDQMKIVVEEIMQNKVYLDDAGRLAITADGRPLSDVVDDAGPSLSDLTP
jgi:DNA-directed RNA polymerase subunit omega